MQRERTSSLLLLILALLKVSDAVALSRGLLQAPTVTYVATAAELVQAAERGDPHIEILKHLDFEDIEVKQLESDVAANATVHLGRTVRSIRGNCQESFPNLTDVPSIASGPELWPQKPGQCLLSGFSGAGIIISQPEGFLCWIDNVYLREGDGLNARSTGGFMLGQIKWHTSSQVKKDISYGWFTNVTMQMNTFRDTVPFGTNTRAYMEDGLILHSRHRAVYVGIEGATAWLRKCEISHVNVIGNTAALQAGSYIEGFSGAVGLILENMTYNNVTSFGDVVALNGSQVYSNQAESVYHTNNVGPKQGILGEFEIAKNISEASSSALEFISWPDAQDLVKEAEDAKKRSPPPPTAATGGCGGQESASNSSVASCGSSGDSSEGDSISTVLVVVIVVCVVAAVAAAVLAAVCYFRRRKAKRQTKVCSSQVPLSGTGASAVVDAIAKPPIQPEATPQDISTSSTPTLEAMPLHGRSVSDTAPVVGLPCTPTHWSIHSNPAHILSHEPSYMASMHGAEAVEEQVRQALEHICGARQVLAGRYELRGHPLQSSGSFGIVQLASIANLSDAVALKFFTSPVGFVSEQRVYSLPDIARVLDSKPVFMDNIDGEALMPSGWPFPAFTVADKGQPLEVWLSSYTADAITAAQILWQVLKAVVAMHSAGYAHRNIKPSNVLQRSKQHDWILIDFSCSCPFGTLAPIPQSEASAAYTAPEVVASAGTSSPPSAVASPEADIWSVGVLAFEVLTGERVFPEGTPPDDIHAALRGQVPLPWEEGAENAAQLKEKLRGLQRLILQCLSRNPKQRPSAKAAKNSFYSMFDNMKTRGTFESAAASKKS